jgi:subtilisin-like proprotein convertase family protein
MQFRYFAGLFLALSVSPFVYAGIISPSPVDPEDVSLSPYIYTGLIGTKDGYTGSGSVAVHPKLVLGCAHMNYGDNGAWLPARSIRWFWKWNQGNYPDDSIGMMLTGYYYFSTYQTNVKKYGMDDSLTFQFDFVANYSATQNTAGGYAGGWVEDGKQYLTIGRFNKLISGYPAGRYIEGDPNEYRMHSTEFRDNMYVEWDNYLGLEGVETGPGNSGGPVWVLRNGEWAFAGVLVSGSEYLYNQWSSIGVYSLNKQGLGIITSALKKTGSSGDLLKKTVALGNVPVAIPDQSSVVQTFTVSGLVGVIQGVKLNLAITHPRKGDLAVTLRSPSGKTVTLLSAVAKTKSSQANLILSGKKVSGFTNLSPNGVWTLTVRDSFQQDVGSLQSGSLEITTH